jgi:single-strand DNA-binding protein
MSARRYGGHALVAEPAAVLTEARRATQGRDRSIRPTGKERRTVNKVLLTGRLTRDPEMRSLASGKSVTTFTVASNEFIGGGREKSEYTAVVTWDRLAEIAGTYLGKGQQVAIEGRLQTRSWDDDRGQRHWKTEVVASHVEMLSGRRKKDYEAQQAAESLVAQAESLGEAPPTEPIAEDPGPAEAGEAEDEEDAEAA